jgi:hypothetical protein
MDFLTGERNKNYEIFINAYDAVCCVSGCHCRNLNLKIFNNFEKTAEIFDCLFLFSANEVQEELTQKLLRKRYEARMKNVRLLRSNPGSNWFENGL